MVRIKSHPLPEFDGEGILLVDKPLEWTSFDVVNLLRRRFNIGRIGHCGTLDPLATGLLVLVIGKRYTRLSQYLSGEDKTYQAEVRLGVRTDSYDREGTRLSEVSVAHLDAAEIIRALRSFEGDTLQEPPMMSALKVGGRKLYELGREGQTVEREKRPITIQPMRDVVYDVPLLRFELTCSKGTYIRSLAHDLGEVLTCGAMLENLRRTRSGRFNLADAAELESLKAATQAELAERLIVLDPADPVFTADRG